MSTDDSTEQNDTDDLETEMAAEEALKAIAKDEVTADISVLVAPDHNRPSFESLGVLPATVAALAAHGITHAFAIQEMTLPLALAGEDLIGQARTGTGKTLGFGIPLLQRMQTVSEGSTDGRTQALVVVPTRELCTQVAADLKQAGEGRDVRVEAIYGGRAFEPQVAALNRGVEVVVGTPGRLIDLMRQGILKLDNVKVLVLDEADEMLDLGFLPDVERLVAACPDRRQTMLFSATMPGPVIALARRFMTRPVHVRAEEPQELSTVPLTTQYVYRAHAMDKVEMVARILQSEGRGLTMIFCRTKRTAQNVSDHLADRGFASAAVHGDLGQGAREQALRAFHSGKVDVLVATDVAARGIDVKDVTHVINYQCPEEEKTYVHRIGRTGRAGASGVAVTLVDWDDIPRWNLINKALGLDFANPVETYSTSEHLYADMKIPAGTKGTLPRAARTRAGLDSEKLEDLGETGRKPAARTGGRDGGRDGGRGAKPVGGRDGARDPRPATATATDEAPVDKPAGPKRERNRTRGSGVAAAVVADPAAGLAVAEGEVVPEGAFAVAASAGEAGDAPRKRRRRGGRGRGKGPGAEGPNDAGADAGDSDTSDAPETPIATPAFSE